MRAFYYKLESGNISNPIILKVECNDSQTEFYAFNKALEFAKREEFHGNGDGLGVSIADVTTETEKYLKEHEDQDIEKFFIVI